MADVAYNTSSIPALLRLRTLATLFALSNNASPVWGRNGIVLKILLVALNISRPCIGE